MSIPQEHPYISIPQLAKQLGISRIAVYNRVKKGTIQGKKIGRNFVVCVHDPQAEIKTQNYLSIPQLAKELGITRAAVHHRVKKGYIHGKKAGKNFIIHSEFIRREKDIEKYVSIPQYAKAVGLSRIAVYLKVRKSQIKAIKIGATYGIAMKDIEKGILKRIPSNLPAQFRKSKKKTKKNRSHSKVRGH